MKNKISIITVNFNNKDGLEKTIKSVKDQDLNIEYIVVDGGSNDGSREIILKNQKYITKWISECDLGIYDAMNKGVKLSSGEWLLFMNSGDIFHNKKTVSKIFRELTENKQIDDVECIAGNTQLMTGDRPYKLQKFNLKKNRFIHQSIFYKKILHNEFGLYAVDPKLTAADYFFISKIINNKNVKIINEIVCDYQIGGVSNTLKTPVQTTAYDYLSGRINYFQLIFSLIKIAVYREIIRILKF